MDFGLLLIIVFVLAPLLEKLLGAGRQRPGQQPPVPPGRQPQQGRMPPSQRSRVPDEDDTPFRSVPASHDDESAASVLPDDLWEILTGERRPPRQDAPEPTAQRLPDATPIPDRTEPSPWRAPPERQETRARVEPAPVPRPEVRPLPTRSREREVVLRDRSQRARERPVETRDRTPRERDPDRIRPGATDADLREPAPAVPARARRGAALADDDEIRVAEDRQRRFRQRMDSDRAEATAAAAASAAETSVYRFNDVADLRRAVVMAEILGPPKSLES